MNHVVSRSWTGSMSIDGLKFKDRGGEEEREACEIY